MNTNDETKSEQAGNSEAKESVSANNKTTERDSLQALVGEEQSFVRERLRKELGREPTQEEVDRWLSEQTEGY
jgi:hypothetical protein